MSRNKALNRIECPNPKKCVIGHWDALKLDFAAKKGGMAVSAVWRLVYFLAPCRSEPKEQTAAHRRDALCPSTQTLHKISARQIPWQFHGEQSGECKTFVPHQMQTYGFRHRFGSIKKVSLHSISHRLAERNPVVALSHDRFRQALRHKPAIALLSHFENEISHKQHLTSL